MLGVGAIRGNEYSRFKGKVGTSEEGKTIRKGRQSGQKKGGKGLETRQYGTESIVDTRGKIKEGTRQQKRKGQKALGTHSQTIGRTSQKGTESH